MTTTDLSKFTGYDLAVAESHMANWNVIYLDEYGKPMEVEDVVNILENQEEKMINETSIKVAKTHEERISRLYHDERFGQYVICLNDGWEYNGVKNEVRASNQKSVLKIIRGLEYVGEPVEEIVEETVTWQDEMMAEAMAVMMEEERYAAESEEAVEDEESEMTELEEKAYSPLPKYVKALITSFEIHEKADKNEQTGRMDNRYVLTFNGEERVYNNYKAMVDVLKKEAKEVR